LYSLDNTLKQFIFPFSEYSLALYYIGGGAASSKKLNVRHIAETSSPVLNIPSNKSCLTFDMALPGGSLEVVLLQYNNVTQQTKQLTVFQSDEYRVEWSYAAFEMALDRPDMNHIQVVFYISLANYSLVQSRTNMLVGALNNLHVISGSCQTPGWYPTHFGKACYLFKVMLFFIFE